MASDERDYKMDIAGLPASPTPPVPASRPFLSVHFTCCNVYQRIYRDADGRRYAGCCPRCRRKIEFAVGADGTASRAFLAG